MKFCYAPWSNIDISSHGYIKPCCKFRMEYYDETFNIQNNNLDDYLNSHFLNEIKETFEGNEWPKGCERCKIEEENNIPSKRQLDYERWTNEYENYNKEGLLTASIAFGNACNLKCITCNPNASSKWRKEYEDIYNVSIEQFKIKDSNTFLDELFSNTEKLIHLDIPGGEPFLSEIELQKKYLNELVQKGVSKNITIHYTTNATIFPDSDWWKLWDNFKEIDMQVSIDGINEKFEYIRFPAKWDDVVKNTHKYIVFEKYISNLHLSVSHTVSAYNIFYLDEFYTWCREFGLPDPWMGRVNNPIFMRPTVWPNKEKIINKLNESKIVEVKNWVTLVSTQDDTNQFDEFCMRVKQHDKYRDLDYNQIFPEMII